MSDKTRIPPFAENFKRPINLTPNCLFDLIEEKKFKQRTCPETFDKQEFTMKKVKKAPPFEFVLEQLYSANPQIRPMFGCHAVYVRNKIVLILRDKQGSTHDNGVWIATSKEHHLSLRKDLPSMRSIRVFGGESSAWQNLPSSANDFEAAVLLVCELILKGDPRIGKETKKTKKAND